MLTYIDNYLGHYILFLLAPRVIFQETGGTVLEFIMFIAFCPLRKKQEIHFADLQYLVLCHAGKQSVYKARAKFRFRRDAVPALREEQGFELTSCHNN